MQTLGTLCWENTESGSPTRLYIDSIWVVFKILISQFFPGDSHILLYAVWMLEFFVLFLLWRQGRPCWWQTLELSLSLPCGNSTRVCTLHLVWVLGFLLFSPGIPSERSLDYKFVFLWKRDTCNENSSTKCQAVGWGISLCSHVFSLLLSGSLGVKW